LIIQTVRRYLEPLSDDRRFDWLYRNNPSGQAKAWMAHDTSNGEIVGMAAAFPRRMSIGQYEQVAWVFGDFCIAERYRSLGPALQLQRACLAACDVNSAAFCYDFPSASMMAVYKRLGITEAQRMLRFAKPLRLDRKVNEKIKVALVARGLTAAGNLLLGLRDHLHETDATLTISIHEGSCDGEFSRLAQRLNDRPGVWVQRSADYLNWRYLAHPLRRYELLTAHRHGELLAYLVFTHDREDAIVADLFGVEDPTVLGSLLEKVGALMRERGLMTLSVPILDSHPWVPLLQRLGFRVRDAGPAVIYVPPHAATKHIRLEDRRWYLMHGDRDS
jgi:hypothetical protein